MRKHGSFILGAALLLTACGFEPLSPCRDAAPGDHLECPTPDWTDRAFDLHVPSGWDGRSPLPVIFAFHGGGGHRASSAKMSCPDGDPGSPRCLTAQALAAGFAVVYPDGTGSRPLRNVRTWNAGGRGAEGYNCASGPACREGVDDMAYLDDLLAAVEATIPVDRARVHAAGLSNGAALSHRWACERPGLVASIAPVGGANQHAQTGGACAGGVAVLQLHGDADPCWRYTPSEASCLEGDEAGLKAGVEETVDAWRARNACSEAPPEETIYDDAPDDGTRAVLHRWDCPGAEVALLRVEGGGHTWPNGHAYLPTAQIGRVTRDLDANQLILEFFIKNTNEIK